MKTWRNAGQTPRLSYFRDAHGTEIDLFVERGGDVLGVEVKSGATAQLDAFKPLARVATLVPELKERVVVYGGGEDVATSEGRLVSFRNIDEVAWV